MRLKQASNKLMIFPNYFVVFQKKFSNEGIEFFFEVRISPVKAKESKYSQGPPAKHSS